MLCLPAAGARQRLVPGGVPGWRRVRPGVRLVTTGRTAHHDPPLPNLPQLAILSHETAAARCVSRCVGSLGCATKDFVPDAELMGADLVRLKQVLESAPDEE